MVYKNEEIKEWDSKFRLRFINSISGYKGVHLIGTKDTSDTPNLAVFNSIVHISSEPARIGFIMRPLTVQRDTYANIKATNYFTINHVHEQFLEQAHYTSAKSDHLTSEFENCKLTEAYLKDFFAPFVGESKIKLGLKLVEDIPITVNDSRLIIGEIVCVDIDEDFVEEDGQIDLEKAKNICVTGLNQYSTVKKTKKLPYARLTELPDFKTKKPDNIVYDESSQSYNANLLAYGTSLGAPKITTNNLTSWKNRNISSYNHTLQSKMDKIKENFKEIVEEYNTNELIYNAEYSFEPIIGETYHLYQKDGTQGYFLSLISPDSWTKHHVGSYKLSADKSWEEQNL